jgi:hypothetical protein
VAILATSVAGTEDEKGGANPRGNCAECGAAFSGEERYCIECGARRGELPAAIAARIATLLNRDRGPSTGQAPGGGTASEKAMPAAAPEKDDGGESWLPSPRAAAAAVIAMLGLGVLLGSATSQLAQSAGVSSIILQVPGAAAESEEAEEPEYVAAAPEAEAASEPVAEVPLSVEAAPLEEEALPEEAAKEPASPLELPEEEALPEVKHVFLIVLGENGYEEAFGTTSSSPYLSKTLPAQGEVVSNYYAVTQGELANRIAMISGQGPTPETAVNCPNYADISPGTLSLAKQVEGNGCVYPTEAESLPAQLAAKELKWRAYVEGIGDGASAGLPVTCRHPGLGGADTSPAPLAGDPYVTWRDPFVYFHAVIDAPECAEADVGLEQLGEDLKSAKRTPALSYIVPDACHAGGPTACEPGASTGVAATESFLEEVVPPILASAAYREGGLIAITSAQAPASAAAPDQSSCCLTPEYPNLPAVAPAAKPASSEEAQPSGGGGRVGLLLLSPFVEPGTVNETSYYNHYSLLLTIEELFELEHLGYAGEVALEPFDGSVFNAAAEEELPEPAKRRDLSGLLGRLGLSRRGSARR